jgi:hypothetical protein
MSELDVVSLDQSIEVMINEDKELVEFMNKKCQEEMVKFKKENVNLIPVKLKNTAICRGKDGCCINRIEFNTSFDFKRVNRILTSNPVPCSEVSGKEVCFIYPLNIFKGIFLYKCNFIY